MSNDLSSLLANDSHLLIKPKPTPKLLSFAEYQALAGQTAVYPNRGNLEGLMYLSLGLASEAGEVAGKIKKIYRDGPVPEDKAEEWYNNIGAEIADVMWYCAMLCTDIGLSLGEEAQKNLNKLASRKERGVLGGSGDQR